MTSSTRKSNRENVQAYRDRMRSRGMRLVQIWVPDTRSPEFAAEARRQSKLVSQGPLAADDQAFIDSLAEFDWE